MNENVTRPGQHAGKRKGPSPKKCLLSLAVLILLCGAAYLFGSAVLRPSAQEAASVSTPDAISAQPEAVKRESVEDNNKAQAMEPEQATEPEPILKKAALDADTQGAIFELCDANRSLFCAVMAIARAETGFTPDTRNGSCVGMMQIDENLHAERMERLGVTDLTDPVQCATVAIDYIYELSEEFGWVDGHDLYLAYSNTPIGALRLNQVGIYTTRYTYEALRYYNEFLSEYDEFFSGLAEARSEEGGA